MRSTKISILIAALACPLAATAQISDDTAVRRMIQEGRFDDALVSLDAGIKKNPRDAQLHLLRGAALSMSNRKGEALKTFAYMVDQRLEIASAYNNIAVILASRGEYESARVALDCALKANPNYVTARQNMGDVYANLSNQAFRQAQHMDRSDPAIPAKLAHLNQMLGNPNSPNPPKPDQPQDGRYYDQPCTPEPLQVARQPLEPAPLPLNPSPTVPAQSPLAPERPQNQPAPAPQLRLLQPQLQPSPPLSPEPTRPSRPGVPLPGRGDPASIPSPQSPVPAGTRLSVNNTTVINTPPRVETVQVLSTAMPAATPPAPEAVAKAAPAAIKWSQPRALPQPPAPPPAVIQATTDDAPDPRTQLASSKPVGLSFAAPKRIGQNP